MPALFDPILLRDLQLDNRVVISPMCQYSADAGSASSWHAMHVGQLAQSGAGCLILEATGVAAAGRITKGCLGLYSDANERAFAALLESVRAWSAMPIGIQLAHAGRKASSQRLWQGDGPLAAAEGAWPCIAPSPEPYDEGWHRPEALDREGMKSVIGEFTQAVARAERLGFDLIEIHAAHGYLLSEFLSPLANQRADEYGGSLENRMRFPLEVAAAMRAAWPARRPMGARINATDWLQGGITVREAIAFAAALEEIGLDFVCVSSGGNSAAAKIPAVPGYQVALAAEIKAATGLAAMAVGLIVDPHQADEVVRSGGADMVAIGRTALDDPRWPWHAADSLGVPLDVAPQFARARPATWPGAAFRKGG
ncbi:MAG: NADH:flavin oxidoreductase/NADH oxidase [Alphaproteobacteria bacterium]|jgi:2,4-dienoyl-CoA reductase-like NADH-dependent reductase (Old Yellow Enzyme family)|nr:NADH:flavin oxidoreductase/NADH oxidase [Alphaproteobacteria bacterium]MDP6588989.1 NADH:flavin oxidoreductase/NADH oxidase [Alphaproteobacteria bacterium]MDP6816996.1 NADH:flavin oxidoreductase/NADH oxidase [Alphaproteobacteria bacterium]